MNEALEHYRTFELDRAHVARRIGAAIRAARAYDYQGARYAVRHAVFDIVSLAEYDDTMIALVEANSLAHGCGPRRPLVLALIRAARAFDDVTPHY